MSGRDRAHAFGAGIDEAAGGEPEDVGRTGEAVPLGGIVTRALRSPPFWLTVGYFAVLLLLARAYA